jgi:hypothetical protein
MRKLHDDSGLVVAINQLLAIQANLAILIYTSSIGALCSALHRYAFAPDAPFFWRRQ